MSVQSHLLPRERRALVADAFVLTTVAAAALLGLLTLLAEEVGDSGWYPWTSSLALLGVVLTCPYLVWRWHGHRSSGSSAVGAAAGFFGGGALLWGLVMAVALVALAVSWASGGTVSQAVAAFVLVTGLLLAVVVVLDVDAVRDLARRHAHVGTDLGRLLATVIALATAGVALWYASAHPGQEPAELLGFALATGVVGAAVALGADLAITVRTDWSVTPA